MRIMEENPFLTYLETHGNAGPETLKELFRVLAKRTHPDLGADNPHAFVRLQEQYHEALARLAERKVVDGAQEPARDPRDELLFALYRYTSRLPQSELDARDLPEDCRRAFGDALGAAERYTTQAAQALQTFHEEFHTKRAQNARYPDVRVKYATFLRGLASFFAHLLMPNRLNYRLTRSYLDEIKPVTDVDPAASPHLRTNRSAAARSALYRMRMWIEAELESADSERATVFGS
ncbi:MAG: hypothetical protein ACOC2Y_00090 [Spirochaetota bacterium]